MIEISRAEIDAFLQEQTVGRVGYRWAGVTHIVPLIYAYKSDAIYVLTIEGQKIRAMRDDPRVCFEVDDYDSASGGWRSVVLYGRFEELEGEDKLEALALLKSRHGMRRQAADSPRLLPESQSTVAFRIRIDSATGRRKEGLQAMSFD
jgi:nitroimidazol reductase NimA-like FMN-containing flavoprotein (pyridoxamine 5'-phosphate oxidase superfamily)